MKLFKTRLGTPGFHYSIRMVIDICHVRGQDFFILVMSSDRSWWSALKSRR